MNKKKSEKKKQISAFEAARQFREKTEAEQRQREQIEAEKQAQIKKAKEEAYDKKIRDEKVELLKMKQGQIEESELIPQGEEAYGKLSVGKKITNFFYHNKLWLILGAFCVGLGGFLAYDLLSKENPDVIVMYIDDNSDIGLSKEFESYLAEVCGDVNGDGEKKASIYYIPFTGNDYNDYNNGVTTKMMAEMQNAEAMIVICGKLADKAISPEATLENLESKFPDNPHIKDYGFYLKGTDFAEKIGYEGEIDDELFIGIRQIQKVQWASLEEMKEAYESAYPQLEKIIEDLSK